MRFGRVAATLCLAIAAFGPLTALAQDNVVLPPTDPAILTMAPEAKVTARQQAMKDDGRMLRGAGAATGADAVTAAQTLVTNFTNFPHLFTEDTVGVGGENNAKPEIWQNWDAFVGLFAEARGHAEAALTAAQAGDMAAYQAALQPIGKLCGDCHQQFRSE